MGQVCTNLRRGVCSRESDVNCKWGYFMPFEKSARRDEADGEQSAADRQINDQLTNYIWANASKVQTAPDNRSKLGAKWIAIPLLYVAGSIVFGLATLTSLAIGHLERRFSTRLWDKLDLPVAASDVADKTMDV